MSRMRPIISSFARGLFLTAFLGEGLDIGATLPRPLCTHSHSAAGDAVLRYRLTLEFLELGAVRWKDVPMVTKDSSFEHTFLRSLRVHLFRALFPSRLPPPNSLSHLQLLSSLAIKKRSAKAQRLHFRWRRSSAGLRKFSPCAVPPDRLARENCPFSP